MNFKGFMHTMLLALCMHGATNAQSMKGFEVSGYPELNEISTLPAHANAADLSVSRIKLNTGVVLEFSESGDTDGLAVIFLHGFTDSRHSFDYLLPHLPSSFRSIVITQRGHGQSDKPTHGYSPENFADDLNAFMEAKDIPAAIIVGHSMGATITQVFALKYPAKARGLVLMGTVPNFKSNPALKEFGSQVALLKDPVDHAFASDFQKSSFSQPIPQSFLDSVINESLKVPSMVWKSVLSELLKTDLSGKRQNIRVPVLIMYGEKDNLSSIPEQKQVEKSIAGARLIVYNSLGHALHWEDPLRTAKDLEAFVKRLQ